MLERSRIQQRGFHNIYNEDGTIWGFQFKMCTLYYKGLWLSQIRVGDCYVDGVKYDRDEIIWEIRGIPYTRQEMFDIMDVYWQRAEPVVIKVKCPGGLSVGYHDVEQEFGWVSNYNNELEKEYDGSGLGNAGPYRRIGGGGNAEHANMRRMLLAR